MPSKKHKVAHLILTEKLKFKVVVGMGLSESFLCPKEDEEEVDIVKMEGGSDRNAKGDEPPRRRGMPPKPEADFLATTLFAVHKSILCLIWYCHKARRVSRIAVPLARDVIAESCLQPSISQYCILPTEKS